MSNATRHASQTDKTVITLEAIGNDKVRVNASAWGSPKVILADEVLWVAGLGLLSGSGRAEFRM
jgi:hypothetical protein